MIAKLNSSGTAFEFVTVLGGSEYDFSGAGIHGLAVGPDGSIYVTGRTCSKDFPTTSDALFPKQPRAFECDAFFSQLSADGSALLYSTYLSGSRDSDGLGITIGGDGQVHLAGSTGAPDFPTTSGIFNLPADAANAYPNRCFLASWNPGSRQFSALTALGTTLNPLAVAWNGTSVALVAYIGLEPDLNPWIRHPIWTSDVEKVILVLDQTNWQPRYAIGLPSVGVIGLALAADDSVTVVGQDYPLSNSIPASSNARLLSSLSRQFVAQFNADGLTLLAASYLDMHAEVVSFTPDQIYISSSSSPLEAIQFGLPFPIVSSTMSTEPSTFYSWPNVVQQCGASTPYPPPSLYWNSGTGNMEVHLDAPDGPLLASGQSGVLSLAKPIAATYFLTDPSGQAVATETVTYQPAARCSAVSRPTGQLTASPNPVLTAKDQPYAATVLTGTGLAPLRINVLSPDGPALTGYVFGYSVTAHTGDWVFDGMPFFLGNSSGLWPLAMERVFLLPVASVETPAIQAKPGLIGRCDPNRHSTLAWSSGGIEPVEIRESTGRVAGRFNQTSGLLDVSPDSGVVYRLFGYTNGGWRELAFDTVSVSTQGCK